MNPVYQPDEAQCGACNESKAYGCGPCERHLLPKLKAAITVVLEHFREWTYEEDTGRGSYSECPSCGWNTRSAGLDPSYPHRNGLGHLTGCKLRAALDELEAVQSKGTP